MITKVHMDRLIKHLKTQIEFADHLNSDFVYITKIEAQACLEIAEAEEQGREPVIIPHISCHHLRHTFCTRFCENETNVKVIQSVMGHADITTTMNIYAEVTDAAKKEAFKNLSKRVYVLE